MSDAGNRRDIELRIRAQDLSTADFQRVAAAVRELSSAVGQETEAAKKGAIGVAELRDQITRLEQAGKALVSLQTNIDRFKDLTSVVTANQAAVEKSRSTLASYRQSLEQSNDTSRKAETQLNRYVRELTQAEAKLAQNKLSLDSITAALAKAGVETAQLARVENELKSAADQVGVSLTALNKAQLDYAKNARESKEATAQLKNEQLAAAAVAKQQAAAVDAIRVKLREHFSEQQAQAVERKKTAEAVQKAESDAEKRGYQDRIKALEAFNRETRRLATENAQRSAADAQTRARDLSTLQQQEQNRVRAGFARAGLRQEPGAGGAARGVPGRAVTAETEANARGLFGLRPYELQNLSYQVNDIISGLASGQRATQIFAQQGGQVLQLFSRNLFSLVRYIPIAAVAVAGLTVAIGALDAVFRNSQSVREFNAVLRVNADGAKYSAEQITQLRKDLRDLGVDWTASGAAIRAAIAAGVQPDQLRLFAEAARNMSVVSGTEVPDAMKKLTAAFTTGFEAVKKLDEAENFLTVTQFKELQALADAGQQREAARRALVIYSRALKEAADTAQSPWTKAVLEMKAAWHGLLETLADTGAFKAIAEGLNLVAGALRGIKDTIKDIGAAWDYLKDRPIFGGSGKIGLPPRGAGKAGVPEDSVGRTIEFFQGKGLSYEQAAGIAGRLAQESGGGEVINPEAFNPAGGGQGAYGVAQARGARQPAYRAAGNNLEGQLEVVWQELNLPQYKKALDGIRRAKRAYDAGIAMEDFELAGNQSFTERGAKTGEQFAETYRPIPLDATEAQKEEARQKQLKVTAAIEREIKDQRAEYNTHEREALILLKEREAREAAIGRGADQAGQDAAARYAREVEERKFRKEDDSRKEAAQARFNRDGKDALAIQAAGQAAYNAGLKEGIKNEEELNARRLRGEEILRTQLAKQNEMRDAERALIAQLAALDREGSLKNLSNIDARLEGVKDKFISIRQNAEKFFEKFTTPGTPNPTLQGKTLSEFNERLNGLQGAALQEEEAKARLEQLNALQADRNALVQTYNTLVEKGTISAGEAEEKTRAAFERTTPAINAAATEFGKFLDSANKLDPTKIDLYRAKMQEFKAEATYISPLMKDIKNAVENSFTSGLSNAFNTVAEAMGKLIVGTAKFKDVLTAVKSAAMSFFAQLLKDIAAAILKYEALKLVSSLGLGGSGGAGGLLASVFGSGGTAAASATASQTGASVATVIAHRGGMIGSVPATRATPASWWANAPRYHYGTPSVGLAPNEQAAILQRGEEVLTRDNPRHIMNRMGGGQDINIRSVLVADKDLIPGAMAGAHGERIVIQHLVKNAATVRQLVK